MTDEAIIDLLFERSEKSIDEINKKYGQRCRSIALEIVGNEQDAEECINDAYLAVWGRVPPEKPKPLSTFVYRILRNISLNKRRAAKRQKRACIYAQALDEISESFASSETVESVLEQKDCRQILKDFLLSLDSENRAIFMKRYWFMESNKDIAAATGISEVNIRVRLLRMREKLRKYLEERGVEI